ncbi:hypothetical protein GEMRC1_001044 [Eukaryota sp. GEM-RC1]
MQEIRPPKISDITRFLWYIGGRVYAKIDATTKAELVSMAQLHNQDTKYQFHLNELSDAARKNVIQLFITELSEAINTNSFPTSLDEADPDTTLHGGGLEPNRSKATPWHAFTGCCGSVASAILKKAKTCDPILNPKSQEFGIKVYEETRSFSKNMLILQLQVPLILPIQVLLTNFVLFLPLSYLFHQSLFLWGLLIPRDLDCSLWKISSSLH